MSKQHTPAPWISAHDGHGGIYIESADGTQIGFISSAAGAQNANAQLIVAAPALLAAAQQAERWIAQQMLDIGWPQERIDSPPEGSHLFNLRAAITDATKSQS